MRKKTEREVARAHAMTRLSDDTLVSLKKALGVPEDFRYEHATIKKYTSFTPDQIGEAARACVLNRYARASYNDAYDPKFRGMHEHWAAGVCKTYFGIDVNAYNAYN
jgi:hypothetical protein